MNVWQHVLSINSIYSLKIEIYKYLLECHTYLNLEIFNLYRTYLSISNIYSGYLNFLISNASL